MDAPHSLVCHPDMPEAAFADLWAMLQAGKAWRGFIKNRRKDGGFYWVLASVTPAFQNNAVIGYTSVRLMATLVQIARVQRACTAINEGDTSYTVRVGHILRTGWRRVVNLLQIDSLRFKVIRLRTLIASTIPVDMVWTHTVPEIADLHGAAWLIFSRDWLWLIGVDRTGLATISDVLLTRTLVRPLEEATTLTTRLAAGDLTTVVEVHSDDGLGEAMRAMGTMCASLPSIVRDIQDGTISVAYNTLQIPAGNHDLFVHAEQQVAALEEIASSTEELASMVTQDASHARVASALTKQASAIVANGGQVV